MTHNTIRPDTTIRLFILFCLFLIGTIKAHIWLDPPIEQVPPLTEELENRIQNKPVVNAKLVRLTNGATQLAINGKPHPFVFGTLSYRHARENLQIGVWKQCGIDLLIVPINLGFAYERKGDTAPMLYQQPEIDFLFYQAGYGDRLPPSAGGINAVLASHQLNGKQFICDNDQRTWNVKPSGTTVLGKGVTYTDNTVGRASNMQQLRAMWRRELGRLWSVGLGTHFFAHSSPWTFNDEQIIQELRLLRQTAESVHPPSPQHPAAEVAVIYDERSVDYLKEGLGELHSTWAVRQRREFDASGVPYCRYYADDLRSGKIPQVKLYIFVNQLNLDQMLVSQIQKLKKSGATLVFLQSTGFVQSQAQRKQAVGIDIVCASEAKPQQTSATPGKHPLLLNLAGTDRLQFDWDPMGLVVQDPDAEALAFYPDTKHVAFAVKTERQYKTVFIGSFMISRYLIHNLAKYAGAWTVAPPEYAVAGSKNLLMVHPLQDGRVTLTLKRPGKLTELSPGNVSSEKKLNPVFDFQAGITYLFQIY